MSKGIQDRFIQHCPNILKLVGVDSLLWVAINKRLESRINYQNQFRHLFSNEPRMLSIHDWVVGAGIGDLMSIAFVKHIDKTVNALIAKLSHKFHPAIKKTVIQMLSEFDEDIHVTNPAYRNYISELASLAKFLENPNFELLALEQPLLNGKSADFLFKNLDDNSMLLIESVSIHLDTNKIESSQDLKDFLLYRLNSKVESKLRALADNHNLVKIKVDEVYNDIPFAVLPTLWYDFEDLAKYVEVFKELDCISPFIMPCCGFVAGKGQSGELLFDYMTISTIYKYLL